MTVLILPGDVEPADLTGIDGAAIGLLSAGIGNVPAAQTYLDVTQGARLNSSLYQAEPPRIPARPGTGAFAEAWASALARAEGAPADLVPGLLAATLEQGGVAAQATAGAGRSSVIAADREGEVRVVPPCAECSGLIVAAGGVGDAQRIAAALEPGDLLIAFERPPADDDRQLALALAGLGPGIALSDSTRLDGLVLSTDLAPTILERFGLPIPDEMEGRPLSTAARDDAAGAAQKLDDRLAAVSPRRGEAVGVNLVIWVALAGVAGLAFGARGLRAGLQLLALSAAYLPFVLLVSAAIEPSEAGERLIAGVGSPALALATLRVVGGWGALAVACAVTVGSEAVDVILGSPLTSRSLLGPNPALGVRFYGIGNELEAVLACLVLLGTGAALAAWRPRASPRMVAAAFVVTALLAVGAFAPGPFGADVGAAIGIPAGAAVAVAVALRAGRRRALLILAAAPAALVVIALLDLVLGGDAHLSRSVLEAGGLDEVGQVAERRLRLCAESFTRYATSPALWAAAALIVAGVAERRRVSAWFDGAPAARAGLLGAVAATLVGTLANDSGAMLLMIGTALTSLGAGYAWATRSTR